MIDNYGKSPISRDVIGTDSFMCDPVLQLQQLKDHNAELERELAVLRNNNTEDIKMKFIKLEQDFEDCKSENLRLKSVMEMTDKINMELRG